MREQFLEHVLDGAVVAWIAWHLEDHIVFEQLNLILGRQDTGLDHPLVARDGEAGQRRRVAVGRWRDRGGSHQTSPPTRDAQSYGWDAVRGKTQWPTLCEDAAAKRKSPPGVCFHPAGC